MNPFCPIYIVSKGRWETRLTSKALEAMQVDYRIVVEDHEAEQYARVIDERKVITLPRYYLTDYETCDDRGDTIGRGAGAARNFCLDHSRAAHYPYHWVLDDNIDGFTRLNMNMKVPVATGAIFKAAEDFVDRYENVPLAGFNYSMFAKRKDSAPPFVLNTRI